MVFTIYGRGGHLGHVTQMPRKNIVPPTQGGSTSNLALINKAVSEKKIFEHCERRRRTTPTDGRTPDHEYPISSPMSLWPFLDGDVPRRPSYGVYISQLIRFARL